LEALLLTLPEKILFFLAVCVSLFFTWRAARRILLTIRRGQGRPDWRLALRRLLSVLVKMVTLQPTFKLRLLPSLFHGLVAWGFMFYLLVNLGDLLEAFIPGFHFLGRGILANLYRLVADILSVGVLLGMTVLLLRRFILRTSALTTRQDVLLHPKAREGIRRDSLVVGAFILIHVGARFLGQSIQLVLPYTRIGFIRSPNFDPWQPFANLLAVRWIDWDMRIVIWDITLLIVAEHVAFWLAIGTILAFLPYFLYSKHLHLFFAPLNFLFKPTRRSIGELGRLDFDDESVDRFGAERLEDLGWEQIFDAYACIMCYRCQEACPAYATGKVLSPATLEINKRYFLNQEGARLAAGEASSQTLLDFAIPAEAVWACTACGACVDVCPVGNEPMRDILDIRRSLVLMDNLFPDPLQAAFRGMERNANPWNIPQTDRLKWAEGLNVPTIDQNPNPELLWWVGCAPATDPRAQKTARAFAQLLAAAGIKYAVLGRNEQCSGDSARRAGNEFLFNELAQANVELLNEIVPRRIVTTCPHCLHTLKNEYPAFGGQYEVFHHSQLIQEWIANGAIQLKPQEQGEPNRLAFHDPCYLGRHNGVIDAPRQVLKSGGIELVGLPRQRMQSFCCGAGGAQMWKEEEPGEQRVSANRVQEISTAGADTLAVGCPFCLIMLSDAAKETSRPMPVVDLAETVLERLRT
jgi:Fe-S oxidoreductase